MNVVMAGVILYWGPEGYRVTGWHSHDRASGAGMEQEFYEHLVLEEVWDVVDGHLNANLPGRDCYCAGYRQQQLFD